MGIKYQYGMCICMYEFKTNMSVYQYHQPKIIPLFILYQIPSIVIMYLVCNQYISSTYMFVNVNIDHCLPLSCVCK